MNPGHNFVWVATCKQAAVHCRGPNPTTIIVLFSATNEYLYDMSRDI